MIGDNLRKLRKQRKLTAKKVGSLLGISESAYCRYELNERKLPLDTALKLADIYDVTLDYMVNMDNLKTNFTLDETSAHIMQYMYTDWSGDFNSLIQLIGTYASLPIEMRKDVAEHDIAMFINSLPECNQELLKFINVQKCKEIVARMKKK